MLLTELICGSSGARHAHFEGFLNGTTSRIEVKNLKDKHHIGRNESRMRSAEQEMFHNGNRVEIED